MSISILVYILSGIIVILLIWIGLTEYRFKKFFAGTKARNLEEVMIEIGSQMKDLKNTQEVINKHLLTVDHRLNKSIRNIDLFNL